MSSPAATNVGGKGDGKLDSHDTVFDDNKTLKSCLKINRYTDQSDFSCIKLAVDSLQTILCS